MPTILYHGNCYDGFGAAYAAWKFFGDQAKYRPCLYPEGAKPLEYVEDGEEVYVLDFSFPREDLLRHKPRLKKLVVLDHHATAEKNLEGLDFCVFDMERSGARIAWDYFHPEKEAPLLIRHIEDRDLWRFKLPHTAEVHIALCAVPFDFKVWDQLDVATLVQSGLAMSKLQQQQVKTICAKANLISLAGFQIPAVNTCLYFSEVPQHLLTIFPEAKFAAYFYDYQGDDGWLRQWGLRSRGDFDVSEIARLYGGGGHKSAAGFVQKVSRLAF